MATIAKAAEIIEANPDLVQFLGEQPLEEVFVAEQALDVTFPESYREFLQRYGCGAFGGRVVYGVGGEIDQPPHVVWATNLIRTADDFFPADLVIIEDTGEGDYLCLATSRMNEENECPVVQWIPELTLIDQTFEVIHSTFAHYLLRLARRESGIV
jgi:hypothetical protein